MQYVQRKFYLPEDTYYSMMLLAKGAGKTIAQVHRELIDEGVRHAQKAAAGRGAAALLDLAKRAEREGWGKGAPKDLAKNHTKYAAQAVEEDLQRIYDQSR